MKSRIKTIALGAVALIAVLFGGLYLIQQATDSAVKKRLEQLLSERTGLATTINGNLSWRYIWPTAVTIEDISAGNEDDTEYWIADSLRLEVSTTSVLTSPRTPTNWRIEAFQLMELRGERGASTMTEHPGDQYAIEQFWIRSIKPETAAPFFAKLRYRARDAQPVDMQLAGKLLLDGSQRKLQFDPAIVSGSMASGECKADIALRHITDISAPEVIDNSLPAVLNVDLWRRSDWDLNCALAQLHLRGNTFENLTLVSNNLLGNSSSQLRLPTFFTGTAEINISIDASPSQSLATANAPRWVITPIFQNVASGPLLKWLQNTPDSNAAPHPWQGPVSVSGRIETNGNNRPALVNNAKGELQLISNNGTLDMTQLKQNIEQPRNALRPLIGDAKEIRDWPNSLEYLTLTGRWIPDQGIQRLTGRLDNVSLDATAHLEISPTDPADDKLRATGTFTFESAQPPLSLAAPPILTDLPLPIVCDGSPTLPRCAMDAKAVQQILADVMQGRGPEGLSGKLNDIIDQNVPEQYQRAARGLLEILGHSINDADAEAMEDFLDEDLDDLTDEGDSEPSER